MVKEISKSILRRIRAEGHRLLRRDLSAGIDPFRLISVSPERIQTVQEEKDRIQRHEVDSDIPTVRGGEWDNAVQPIAENPMYRSLEEHFNEGVPWDETEWGAENIQRAIEDSAYGCPNESAFREKLSHTDSVYESIKNSGFKTQREVRDEDPEYPRCFYYCPELHDVTVNIGRDGEIILHRGWHRTIISKLVGLDEIKVRVNVRHREWQSTRQRVIDGEERPTHPDLVDLGN